MKSIVFTLVLSLVMCCYYVSACTLTPEELEPSPSPTGKEIKTLPELRSTYDISLTAYIYNRTLDHYMGRPTELAGTIVNFGLTDIYLNFSRHRVPNEPDLANFIRELISALSVNQVRVHALAFTEINTYGAELQETLDALADYQAMSAPNERFVGINFDIEPHIMRQSRDNWKKVSDKYGLHHIDWLSDQGYGKDGANSKVMEFVLSQIKEVYQKTIDNNFIYSQALGHFFEDRYADGSLSAGGVNDFLKSCDHVIIMNYTDTTDRLIRFSMAEFTNANKPRSVEIAVKTSDNNVGDLTTSFADEGWDTMMEALVALCEAAKPYPTFRGVSFFEFESLEDLWAGRDSGTK